MILQELFSAYTKFQEIKNKAIKQNNNSDIEKYEVLILESIKLSEKTSEEMYLERLLEGNESLNHNHFITEEDYKKILECIYNLNFKINFLKEYKRRRIEKIKNEKKYLESKYEEIEKMDFSITNSLEKSVDINIPYKKIIDFSIINSNNCDVENNLIKFENFNVFDEPLNKAIDITNHNINIDFFGVKKNVFYLSLVNTKTSNDFIINIRQNGLTKNIYSGKLKHNAIINIAANNVDEIIIYSEADISYLKDSIKVKCFNGESEYRKGFFTLLTKEIHEVNNMFINSEYDFQSYIFDESVEINYNNAYEDMLSFCENNFEKITFNENIPISINKKFNIICFFNTTKTCAALPDIYYE